MRLASHVTCFFLFFTKQIEQRGGASRWRVCYQRGLVVGKTSFLKTRRFEASFWREMGNDTEFEASFWQEMGNDTEFQASFRREKGNDTIQDTSFFNEKQEKQGKNWKNRGKKH